MIYMESLAHVSNTIDARLMVCLHCPTPNSYADADTDSCTKKVTMEVNRMALLNGYRTHLSQPSSLSRSTGNTSEHYH